MYAFHERIPKCGNSGIVDNGEFHPGDFVVSPIIEEETGDPFFFQYTLRR